MGECSRKFKSKFRKIFGRYDEGQRAWAFRLPIDYALSAIYVCEKWRDNEIQD
jgi:hypothetical protein